MCSRSPSEQPHAQQRPPAKIKGVSASARMATSTRRSPSAGSRALKSSTTSGRCTAGSITCEGSPSSSSKRVRKVSWRAISAWRARSKAGQSSSLLSASLAHGVIRRWSLPACQEPEPLLGIGERRAPRALGSVAGPGERLGPRIASSSPEASRAPGYRPAGSWRQWLALKD